VVTAAGWPSTENEKTSMNYFLNVVGGPNAGPRRPLTDHAVLVIGRGDDCDLRLNDPSVSRVHARVTLLDGRVYLEDAGSRWGTLVNGIPTDSRELSPGDRVEIGDSQLRLESDSPLVTTIAPIRRRILDRISGRRQKNGHHPNQPPATAAAPTPAPRKSKQTPRGVRPRLVPIDLESLIGKKFLQYQVESVIARPRSGIVFRALDLRHGNRPMALKVFRPDNFKDPRGARRFLRAMRTTIPLEHENLVRVFGAGRTRGLCFTASEFVDGESVSQMIRRIGVAGMLDWRNAWHIACGVAEALEFAHEANIVHRNIGPSNILIRGKDRCVKLGDLMLAKALDESGNERITCSGEVVGDLRYLSPEQLSGEQPIDARADIYSLGATLYAVLTGKAPFEGGTAAEIIRRVVTGAPEPPTRFHLGIPSQFEGVVLRMLAVRPEDRPETATRLRAELERVGKLIGA
jgi:serine/threonine protein kinase